MDKPLAIDLFCGAGGMSEGILQAGFHIVFSSDINEDVERTYVSRHEQLGYKQGIHTHFRRADVRKLNGRQILWFINKLKFFRNKKIKEIDAIFGGPPCQGFSRAGKREKSDPRNILFREYIRIVSEIKPKYVIMENVEGFLETRLDNFLGYSGKRYPPNTLVTDILKEEFNKIRSVNYITKEPLVVDASDYGVPQRRKRVIFCAYREDQPEPIFPPRPLFDKKVTVRDAIGDLSKEGQISDYIYQSSVGRTPDINGKPINNVSGFKNNDRSKHTKDVMQRFSLFHPGESKRMLQVRLINEGLNLYEYPDLLRICAVKLNRSEEVVRQAFNDNNIDAKMFEVLLTRKNSRVRLDANDISPTVMTLPDDFIHYSENRILSVREMARLQSFDDSFEFKGKRTTGGKRRKLEVPQYTQVGNAVPPLLAKALATEIRIALSKKKVRRKHIVL